MKTADSGYLFTQNYTQTVIACRDNKSSISIEMYLFRCYWWNNGSIVNVNIIQRVSSKLILYKVHAVAVLELLLSELWPLLQVCVCACVRASTAPGVCVLGWVKCREQIALLVILCIIMYVKKKNSKPIFFFTKPITDYGKMLKYREKYR